MKKRLSIYSGMYEADLVQRLEQEATSSGKSDGQPLAFRLLRLFRLHAHYSRKRLQAQFGKSWRYSSFR